jgi:hypothetical protein
MNHLSFHDMSSLYDNDVATENEKSRMLDHIDSCELCKKEYLKLQNMMKLLSRYRNQEYLKLDLSKKVVSKYQFRRKKITAKRLIPAAAALVFFIFGLGILPLWFNKDAAPLQYTKSNDKAAKTEVQKVIGIISENNAVITNVTDLYIEGQIPYKEFNSLRKSLGFRKVTYSVTRSDSSSTVKNIEEVAARQNTFLATSAAQDASKEVFVKFRVYK